MTETQLREQEIKQYFRGDTYSYFIYLRTYSKWRDDLGRRELWQESVQRYMDFMKENLEEKLSDEEYAEIQEYILHQKVMPSMRLLWSAGKSARRTNVAGYNCSYIAPNKPQDFGEILYLLTNGCGVGFSVEKEVVAKLPVVKKKKKQTVYSKVTIEDSREGWADSLVLGMKRWLEGADIFFDYSAIRPEGSRLKTFGGRASGAAPLKDLLDFTKKTIRGATGRKLTSLEVHDIVCKIGQVVVAGGSRRSSLISLSDLDDEEMRLAKFGKFWETAPHRTQSNNSAVYTKKPKSSEFLDEWASLAKSGSGERGIFNRGALRSQMPLRRELKEFMGTNPCGEITLRSKQFCNLSEVVCREEDTVKDLLNKIRIATIIGTYQASLTNFDYLSDEWKKNCEEERLLGVSLTGIADIQMDFEVIKKLKDRAIEVNKEYAKRLGINTSTSVTCIKPSGTVSQLVNASSGAHPRFAPYYIRRVEISETDPLFKLLKDQGIPAYPRPTQKSTWVLEFPIKSPEKAITKDGVTAIEQLDKWKLLKTYFTEHNPSTTIYVGEDEWITVADWLWKNWEMIGGLSFLPRDDHVYELAPYEAISKSDYQKLIKAFPKINFSNLSKLEKEDNTSGGEAGCTSDTCEIDVTLSSVVK